MIAGTLSACGGGGETQTTAAGGGQTTAAAGETTAAAAGETTAAPADTDAAAENTDAAAEGGEETPAAEVAESDPFKTYDLGGQTFTLLSHNNFTGLDPEGTDDPAQQADRQANLDRVQEKYNCKIEFVSPVTDNWDDFASGIISEYTAGHPVADVMDAYYTMMGAYVANDILYDFGDTLVTEGGVKAINTMQWAGKDIGVTMPIGGEGIYYNKSWIQELGMEYTPAEMFDMGKWDYENAGNYMRELKAKMAEDEYPLHISPGYWILFAPNANGIPILDGDGQLNYVTDAFIESMQYFQDWMQEGLVSWGDPVYAEDGTLQGYEGWSYPGNTFGQGKTVAMAHRGAWQAASEVGNMGEMGFVPYPWGSNVSIDESKVGQPGAYLTLSDNYHHTHFDGQLICLTKGTEQKGDPIAIMTMVMDLMGWKSVMSSYVAPEESKQPPAWLEEGLDADLYNWACDRQVLEKWNSIDFDGFFTVEGGTASLFREKSSIRSKMVSTYASDMQILIDNGFTTPDKLQNYSE